jgi:hypothetical protein
MSANSASNEPNAKNPSEEFDRFTDFMRRLVAVPHSEIKSALDAEKAEKRASKASSRVPAEPSSHS